MRAPGVPRSIQTPQSGQISTSTQVVQIQIRRGHRRVPHPSLNRNRVDAPRQPQAGCRVTQIVDPPAIRSLGPMGRPFQRARVQLMGRFGNEQPVTTCLAGRANGLGGGSGPPFRRKLPSVTQCVAHERGPSSSETLAPGPTYRDTTARPCQSLLNTALLDQGAASPRTLRSVSSLACARCGPVLATQWHADL